MFSCQKQKEKKAKTFYKSEKTIAKDTLKIEEKNIAYEFDFPVGKPNAKGYYNAQKFQENYHLGDDWNSVKGGNSDLGDPIYAIADGYVVSAKDYKGGWGNIVRIIHFLPNGNKIESLYAHCDEIKAEPKSWVKKGDTIATIGTANGAYLAHLHFEIRESINMPIGGGYSKITKGYVDPTKFIKEHRKVLPKKKHLNQ